MGVTEGELLKHSGAATYFSPGNIGGAVITGITGAIMTSGQGVSDPGTFVTIEFTSGIVEGSGSFTLSGVIVGDVNSSPVVFKLSDTRVSVVRQAG